MHTALTVALTLPSDVAAIVSWLSRSTTLVPGTVILTGTPSGVGYARQPPVWLQQGDTVTVQLEGVGSLTNPVTSEDEQTGPAT